LGGKLIRLFVVFFSIINIAAHANDNVNFNSLFYLGLDAVYSNMQFRKDFGRNIFNKSTVGGNIAFGYSLTNTIGFEVGHEEAKKKKTEVTLYEKNYAAGWLVTNYTGPVVFKSEFRQRHSYFGVIFNSNINEDCFASILFGASLSKIKAQYSMLQSRSTITGIDHYSKTKLIPTARLALIFKLADHVGIRIFSTWRDTNKFKIKSKEYKSYTIKLNNYFNWGIGVLFI
jgi:hypothetical protein